MGLIYHVLMEELLAGWCQQMAPINQMVVHNAPQTVLRTNQRQGYPHQYQSLSVQTLRVSLAPDRVEGITNTHLESMDIFLGFMRLHLL
ncbi:unnamed protein product [Callosobruchus maculatus]|uniref:Uncharacterized protein n=1 Tax=Callosobruchus maculatus TaxID=64391 RepID=A0A653C5I8_CALMS|nr:unnamed protein product [Callosobruchus maculatus]